MAACDYNSENNIFTRNTKGLGNVEHVFSVIRSWVGFKRVEW